MPPQKRTRCSPQQRGGAKAGCPPDGRCPNGIKRCCDPATDKDRELCHFVEPLKDEYRAMGDSSPLYRQMTADHLAYHRLENKTPEIFPTISGKLNKSRYRRGSSTMGDGEYLTEKAHRILGQVEQKRRDWRMTYLDPACYDCDATCTMHEGREKLAAEAMMAAPPVSSLSEYLAPSKSQTKKKTKKKKPQRTMSEEEMAAFFEVPDVALGPRRHRRRRRRRTRTKRRRTRTKRRRTPGLRDVVRLNDVED